MLQVFAAEWQKQPHTREFGDYVVQSVSLLVLLFGCIAALCLWDLFRNRRL